MTVLLVGVLAVANYLVLNRWVVRIGWLDSLLIAVLPLLGMTLPFYLQGIGWIPIWMAAPGVVGLYSVLAWIMFRWKGTLDPWPAAGFALGELLLGTVVVLLWRFVIAGALQQVLGP